MIKQELEKRFFPYVIKPGRYAGGELGTITKDHAGKTLYCHAYPDKYELGQSYLGLQTLYHVVNTDDRFACERVYAVDTDAEEILRKEKLPLFSLESRTPLKEFDALGFTLSFELVFTNLLNMLNLAGMSIRANERQDSDPIIMAGGPAAYNPEPLADFVDIFFIGDAEEGLLEMLEIIHNLKGKPKREILLTIAQKVQSVYIPMFYDKDRVPIEKSVPKEIFARTVPFLKAEYYPTNPIVPLVETVHEHLSVEIMRGCPQGCRFCQAGSIYRPVRMRPLEELVKLVETQVQNSGTEVVTLLSLSSSDYKEIENLASIVARNLEKDRVSVTLPSLRPGTISSKLLNAVKRVRRSGMTIAPEAGSERLRAFIRKNFSDETVYDTVSLAYEKGWTTIKLYFMVGLPTETYKDLDGIVNMVNAIYKIGARTVGRKIVNVTLSPFVPKAHTPFQWDEIVAPEEVLKRINYVKFQIKNRNISFKYPVVETNLLQGLIGRGGRVMGDVIETAYKNGARFDGWNEFFNFERWEDAMKEHGIDYREMLKPISFSKNLPWSHIRKGVSTDQLKKERERTSMQLIEFIPQKRDVDISAHTSKVMEFGRSNKKVATKETFAPTKNKVRFRFGKDSRYKYMGHLDNLRLIERVLRKSKLPIAYSQGFNPSMKLSFGPPLTLGFTSESEFMDITFDSNFMPEMADRLKESMPDGFILYDAKIMFSRTKSISALLNRALYRISLDLLPSKDVLELKIKELLAREKIEVERHKKRGTIVMDLRSSVYALEIKENDLYLTLGIGEGGYAKPGEILQELIGDDFDLYMMNFFHRLDLYREEENGKIYSAMEL